MALSMGRGPVSREGVVRERVGLVGLGPRGDEGSLAMVLTSKRDASKGIRGKRKGHRNGGLKLMRIRPTVDFKVLILKCLFQN